MTFYRRRLDFGNSQSVHWGTGSQAHPEAGRKLLTKEVLAKEIQSSILFCSRALLESAPTQTKFFNTFSDYQEMADKVCGPPEGGEIGQQEEISFSQDVGYAAGLSRQSNTPKKESLSLKPSIQMDSPQFTDSKVKTFTRPVDNVRPKEPEFISFKEASRNSHENQQSSKAGNLDRFMKPNPSQQDSIDVQRPSLLISQSFGSKQFDAQNMKTLVSRRHEAPVQKNTQMKYFSKRSRNNEENTAGRFRSEYIAAKPSQGGLKDQSEVQQARFAVNGSKHSSVNEYPSVGIERQEGYHTVAADNYKSQNVGQFKMLSKFLPQQEVPQGQSHQLWAGSSWKEDEPKFTSGELWSRLPAIGEKTEDHLKKAAPSNKALVPLLSEEPIRTQDFQILKRFIHNSPQEKKSPHTRSTQQAGDQQLKSPLSVQTTGPRFSAGVNILKTPDKKLRPSFIDSILSKMNRDETPSHRQRTPGRPNGWQSRSRSPVARTEGTPGLIEASSLLQKYQSIQQKPDASTTIGKSSNNSKNGKREIKLNLDALTCRTREQLNQ
jgi:hypothetical protein